MESAPAEKRARSVPGPTGMALLSSPPIRTGSRGMTGDGERGSIKLLVIAVLVSLGLAFGAAYAAVVSQNPGTRVPAPSPIYGNEMRPSP